jgi:hypothetical protein
MTLWPRGCFRTIEEYLGSYLAGLLEGDGYLSITNENRVIIGITFNSKDTPLAVGSCSINYVGTTAPKFSAIARRQRIMLA